MRIRRSISRFSHIRKHAVRTAAPYSSCRMKPLQIESIPPAIWRFVDDRPGHCSQSAGLCQAIQSLRAHRVFDVSAPAARTILFGSRQSRNPAKARELPHPALIIGAGHRTHLPMLAARLAAGGRVIVLMRPSLPMSWFDCCILPQHDLPRRKRPHVIMSRGALNGIVPVARTVEQSHGRGLILVGGPSRHYDWSDSALVAMIRRILHRQRLDWIVSDSRRTPEETSRHIESLALSCGARFLAYTKTRTQRGWVAGMLAQVDAVWVTEDSVSSVCEALSAGVATGLLPVPNRGRKRALRLRHLIDGLLKDGLLCSFHAWEDRGGLPPPPQPLQEALRCARILRDWGWV